MTIGFSTHWPKTMPAEYAGKPTYFVEKITRSASKIFGKELDEYITPNADKLGYGNRYDFIRSVIDIHPKKHTFRKDSSDRWKPGMKIHAVIFNRTKNRYQFVPILECKSIQKVEIIYSDEQLCDWHGVEPVIKIDDRVLDFYDDEMETLAKNDGFESLHHFCNWFNEDWSGKIIHWTDLKY